MRAKSRKHMMKRFIQMAIALLAMGIAGPSLAKDVKIGLSWDARESALNQAWEDFMKAEARCRGLRWELTLSGS